MSKKINTQRGKEKSAFEALVQRVLKPLDYLFVLRPTLFLPVWALFLAGFYQQQEQSVSTVNSANGSAFWASKWTVLSVGLAVTLLMGGVFVLNQIRDRQTDKVNNKLFLIADGHLSERNAYIEAVIVLLMAAGIGFYFSAILGVLFILTFMLTGYMYSFDPFNWKDAPFPGLLANVGGALLIFAIGWLVAGVPRVSMLIHAVPYLLAVASVYLLTTLPDVEGDASAEKMTFGVIYGTKTTVYASFVLEIAALVTSYILRDELIFYPALYSLPFFIWAVFGLQMAEIMRAIKYPIAFLALTVAIKWWVVRSETFLFFVLIGLYIGAKIYYRYRFGVDYPNLSAH